MAAEPHVTVHRFEATLFPVNTYLVEMGTAVVVVGHTIACGASSLAEQRRHLSAT
jgi:hypothetical protein